MNWVEIGSDPFAIERQRIKGVVDNCHALIKKSKIISIKISENLELLEEYQWKFVNFFDLNEIDASLSISLTQPKNTYKACCQTIYTK